MRFDFKAPRWSRRGSLHAWRCRPAAVRTNPSMDARWSLKICAFTLLELLIATVVFAIVLAAMSGVFYGALRLRNKSTAAVEQAIPMQRALATIKKDLSNLV